MNEGISHTPRWVGWLVGVVLAAALVYWLRGVLTPVLLAFGIAYLLDPVVDRFEARGVRRDVAIGVLLTLFLGAIAIFVILIAPGILREIRAFIAQLPLFVAGLLDRYAPILAEYGIEVPRSIDQALAELQVGAAEVASQAISPIAVAARWVVGGTASVLGAIGGLIMIPVFAFYLLHDFDRIVEAAGTLVPKRHRERVFQTVSEVDDVLGHFVRGQLIVMLAMAVLYSIAYSLVGIRLAVPIGIAGGLLSFIPYVGGAVALGMALLMCVFDGLGLSSYVAVVVVYGSIQLFEGFVLTPKILGDEVGLSSIWVLFALLLGGETFGFLGVLLAVPGAAVAKIFVLRGMAIYRKSEFYGADDGPAESTGPEARERRPDGGESASPEEPAPAAASAEDGTRREGDREKRPSSAPSASAGEASGSDRDAEDVDEK